MQSALALSSPVVPCATPPPPPPPRSLISCPRSASTRFASVRSNALAVNYNSTISVFPAEACDTVGGHACAAEMFPELKLKQEPNKKPMTASEPIEREYLDYADSRTVLMGEACDVLGGEFCEAAYLMGVH